MERIDLRSDTVTQPTEEMLDAMRRAPLGDDVYGEDPTVNRLEELAAERLGREAALFVASGTMGNLISVMVHAGCGDEAILDPESHIAYYEAGSMASVAGVMPRFVPSRRGVLDAEDVVAAIRKPDVHFPRPRLLCLENTHNRAGGVVTPLVVHKRLCSVAHQHNLRVHLDGARIFNAAVASGRPASDYAADADSVMFCLSKGLSCPVGSLIVGDKAFIAEARRCRKRIGGGMRQAGVLAAPGIVALEKMIDRLAEDHANCRRLAEGLQEISGLSLDMDSVETNMVYVDHTRTGLDTESLLARLAKEGVLVSPRPPTHFRCVTHRHVTDAHVRDALRRIRYALNGGLIQP